MWCQCGKRLPDIASIWADFPVSNRLRIFKNNSSKVRGLSRYGAQNCRKRHIDQPCLKSCIEQQKRGLGVTWLPAPYSLQHPICLLSRCHDSEDNGLCLGHHSVGTYPCPRCRNLYMIHIQCIRNRKISRRNLNILDMFVT